MHFVFRLFFIAVVVHSSLGACPEKWTEFHTNLEKKCFYVNETKVSPQQNFQLCKSLNSSMVSIHSTFENEFLKTLLKLDDAKYWTGGIQVMQNSKAYAWLDGSQFSYSNWAPNKPNDQQKATCIVAAINKEGVWFDVVCSNNGPQLCQTTDSMDVITDEFANDFITILTKNAIRSLKTMSSIRNELLVMNNSLTSEIASLTANVMLNNSDTIAKLDEKVQTALNIANNNSNLLKENVNSIKEKIHNSSEKMREWKNQLNASMNTLNNDIQSSMSHLESLRKNVSDQVNTTTQKINDLNAKLENVRNTLNKNLTMSNSRVKYIENRLDEIESSVSNAENVQEVNANATRDKIEKLKQDADVAVQIMRRKLKNMKRRLYIASFALFLAVVVLIVATVFRVRNNSFRNSNAATLRGKKDDEVPIVDYNTENTDQNF